MFSFFTNTKKITELELKIAELELMINKITDETSEGTIESKIERAIDDAVDAIDFESKAQDAIEEVIGCARLSVEF